MNAGLLRTGHHLATARLRASMVLLRRRGFTQRYAVSESLLDCILVVS